MRLAIALFLVTFLVGCAGMFAGEYTETEGTSVSKITGLKKKLKTRKSKIKIISEETTKQITQATILETKRIDLEIEREKNRSVDAQCMQLSFEQVSQLKADAQSNYLQGVERCQERQFFAGFIRDQNYTIQQLTQGDSDVAKVAKYGNQSVQVESRESTNKVKALASPTFIPLAVGLVEREKSNRNEQNRFADLGKEASKNGGDTTIGDINLPERSQSSSADSNDGSEGLASAGEGTASASGSGVSSNTSSDAPVTNIVVGEGNALSFDDSIAQGSTDRTIAAEPSATTGLNSDDVNVDYQPIIDDNQNTEGTQSNQPNVGNNNGLF